MTTIANALWWSTAIALVCLVYRHGALDWVIHYLPATQSGYAAAADVGNPPYILFLFYPLSLLPIRLSCAVMAAINVLCTHISCKLTGANRWLVLFTHTTWVIISFGQLDGLVALGAALGSLAIQSGQGWLLGSAILLLGIKPQVGGLLALVYLFYLYRSVGWRPVAIALAVIVAVILASFIAFGFWLPVWATKVFHQSASGGGELYPGNNIGLFPYGLIALLFTLILARHSPAAWVASALVAAPYAGFYSVFVSLVFPLPWFVYAATWLPTIYTDKWALLTPIFLIIVTTAIIEQRKRRLSRRQTVSCI